MFLFFVILSMILYPTQNPQNPFKKAAKFSSPTILRSTTTYKVQMHPQINNIEWTHTCNEKITHMPRNLGDGLNIHPCTLL